MPKVPNHLHKYKKVNLGSDKDYFVYRCLKPACSHYIPVHMSEGKLCECNRCHEPMIITKIVLQGSGGRPQALPHCADCTKKKKDINVDAIAEFLERNEI